MFGKNQRRVSSGHRSKWYHWLVDLIIVFLGVYMASLFSNYNESQKNAKQRDKVLSSLKLELEAFRFGMPEYADFQAEQITKWNRALNNDSIIDFYEYRFIQPQYDYTALEYAIKIDETEVVDFELFTELRTLYNNIKSLEFSENLMTETAQQFKNTSKQLPKNHPLYHTRKADNAFYFYRFITFANSRQGSLQKVGQQASATLQRINQQLSPKKRVKIEQQLIGKFLKSYNKTPPQELAFQYAQEFFPNLTTAEINQALANFYKPQ
ncbi:MAG: hypothetical protein ACPGJS_09455 [Flammeovirgaceae bacterium]